MRSDKTILTHTVPDASGQTLLIEQALLHNDFGRAKWGASGAL